MSKEIVKQEEQEVMSFGAFSGMGEVEGIDVNASDMKLPKIKLLQQTSLEVTKSNGKFKAGQFYNTVTQEAFDEIDCILLNQGKSMIMWNEKFKRGEDPICRSFDGKVKAEGCGDGDCTKCQYSSQNPIAWETAKKEDKTKPPCSMSYVFIAQDLKTGAPFRFIVGGASAANGKSFLNKLVPLLKQNKMPIFVTTCKLTSKQEENDQGIYYVINMEGPRPNPKALKADGSRDDEAIEKLRADAELYKDLFMTSIVQRDIVDVDYEQPQDTSEAGGLF